MKKILTYLAVFFASGTIITVVGLSVLERFVYSIGQTSTIITSEDAKTTTNKNKKIEMDSNIQNVEYSYNNKYYTYLKDGKIYIDNVSDGKNSDIVGEENSIIYSKLLYDKNLILYFTEQKNGSTSKLTLHTYDIDTERDSKYNTFNVKNFTKVKDMNMSPIINIIYINVESKVGTSVTNTVYSINLFNSMSTVSSGKIVEKMIMLQQRDRIYYQDNKDNIYMGNTRLNIFKEKVDMIGIDEDDKLYFISKQNKNKVYVVLNNKVIDTIELSDTDLVETYSNNRGVYLIYPTYVINVAGEDPYKRIGKFSKYVTFEAIKENTMYLRMKDNILITTELLKN